MCGICIGGMCIPYEALLPVIFIGIQWMVTQFAKVGLEVPEFIAKRLGNIASSSGKDEQQDMDDPCGDGIFCFCKRIIGKGPMTNNSSESSVASTTATYDDDDDSADENMLLEQNDKEGLKKSGIKFINAPWCMPCNEVSTETWYDATSD